MTCKKCDIKPVWEFTNQTKLCKRCFLDYFDKKVFRTIRKYNMLNGKTQILLKKDGSLNTNVLKSVLEQNFVVKFSPKADFSAENLSEAAEGIFLSLLEGKFKGELPKNKPLYFLSDKEIELYAKLRNIKGKKRKQNTRTKKLFERFQKNPDLEHNIVNAFLQLD